MTLPTPSAIALLLAGLASVGVSAQVPDPFVGTWKLNVAKSKTTFKSGTTVVEKAGDGITTTADMVRGDGTADHFTWTAKYDGRDNPVIGASPYGSGAHSIALTRIQRVWQDNAPAHDRGHPATGRRPDHRRGSGSVRAFERAAYVSSGGGPSGSFLRAGGALGFGDLLGERRLSTVVQVGSRARSSDGRLLPKSRATLELGAVAELEPSLRRVPRRQLTDVDGQAALAQETHYHQRIQLRAAGLVAYPLSHARRLEFTAGVRHARTIAKCVRGSCRCRRRACSANRARIGTSRRPPWAR
jgi:hypothetical protein